MADTRGTDTGHDSGSGLLSGLAHAPVLWADAVRRAAGPVSIAAATAGAAAYQAATPPDTAAGVPPEPRELIQLASAHPELSRRLDAAAEQTLHQVHDLLEVYDPEAEHFEVAINAPMVGNPFIRAWDGTERPQDEMFRRLPETPGEAQELATREAADAARAVRGSRAATVTIRSLVEQLGEAPSRSDEGAEVTRLFDSLTTSLDDMETALAPSLQVDGHRGVRDVLDQISGTRAELHRAIERHADQQHALVPDDADATGNQLHAAITTYAANRHDLADARAGLGWAYVCHASLTFGEAEQVVDRAIKQEPDSGVRADASAQQRLPPTSQAVIDRGLQAGPATRTGQSDPGTSPTSAGTAGRLGHQPPRNVSAQRRHEGKGGSRGGT